MSESTDIAGRTSRFNEAARAYTPPSPSRHAKLMPFKDGIVELRQKGGSLRLIREPLATVGVNCDLLVIDCRAASTDLFIDFFDEVGLAEVLRTLDARLTVICPVNHEADSVEQ